MRATTTRSARPRSCRAAGVPRSRSPWSHVSPSPTSGSLAGTAYGAPGRPGPPARYAEPRRRRGRPAAGRPGGRCRGRDQGRARRRQRRARGGRRGRRAGRRGRQRRPLAARAGHRRAGRWRAATPDGPRPRSPSSATTIAGLAVAGYEGAGDLSSLDAAFGGEGPEGVMGRLLSYEGASTSLDAGYQQFAATSALAQTFRDRAAEEKQRSEDLAAAGRAEAQAAGRGGRGRPPSRPPPPSRSARAPSSPSSPGSRASRWRSWSPARPASRRPVARRPPRRRPARPAAQERAAARAAAERGGRRPRTRPSRPEPDGAGRAARPARRHQAPAPRPAAAPAPAARPGSRAGPGSCPGPCPAAPSPPRPRPRRAPTGRSPSRCAQVGEPYLWAAAGPSSWDCSGLTMAAWAAGGRSLPHYSVAQYTESTPISVEPAAPGRPRLLGLLEQPELDPPRRALRRRRPDRARPAHRSRRDGRVDVLLDPAELLRPRLSDSRAGPVGSCHDGEHADRARDPRRRRRADHAAGRPLQAGARPRAGEPRPPPRASSTRPRPSTPRPTGSGSRTSSSSSPRPARPATASPRSTAAAATSAPRWRPSRPPRWATCRCW